MNKERHVCARRRVGEAAGPDGLVSDRTRVLFSAISIPGGPEAFWRDLGGGMGTHRASGDVKAGTGLKQEGHR
jgi:hypothetical protein